VDVANKFQEVWVFFADDGFVSVLEEMACTLMFFIEGNRITGHEFPHDLAEGGRAGAQKKVKMIRDQGPGITLGLGFFQDDGQAVEEGFAVFVIKEELAAFDATGHDVLEKAGGI